MQRVQERIKEFRQREIEMEDKIIELSDQAGEHKLSLFIHALESARKFRNQERIKTIQERKSFLIRPELDQLY